MLGGILALDMGGYQLCKELALDPAIGRYGGIIVGATLGCTITFTIPVGMGMLGERRSHCLQKGILAGLECAACRNFGGRTVVRSFYWEIAHSEYFGISSGGTVDTGTFPIPGWDDSWISCFAEIIRGAGTIGIALGAFSYMTGVQLLPEMAGLDEALG